MAMCHVFQITIDNKHRADRGYGIRIMGYQYQGGWVIGHTGNRLTMTMVGMVGGEKRRGEG
jgi:hypothetical protein